MLKSAPDKEILTKYRETWIAERKPYMEPNLVGIEFTGGKGGRANAAKLNGPGNEPCAGNVSDYLVVMAALLYSPPGPDGDQSMFESSKVLARKLVGLLDDQDQSDYVNVHMDADDDAHATKIVANAYNDLDRVKAIKAKVDPNNLFYRGLIKME